MQDVTDTVLKCHSGIIYLQFLFITQSNVLKYHSNPISHVVSILYFSEFSTYSWPYYNLLFL